MTALAERERSELIRLIEAGQPLPEKWRGRLFPASTRTVEIGKEYRLEYEGKMKREAMRSIVDKLSRVVGEAE